MLKRHLALKNNKKKSQLQVERAWKELCDLKKFTTYQGCSFSCQGVSQTVNSGGEEHNIVYM